MKSDFLKSIRPLILERAQKMPAIDRDSLPRNDKNFCDIFSDCSRPTIIAEIKFASPSKGRIYSGSLNSLAVAADYLMAGASALSVLTEPEFFKGDISYLKQIRKYHPEALLLLKDFVLDEKQIAEARLCGANAVLLIVAFLDDKELENLFCYADSLGMTSIIEVHNLEELERAQKLSPEIIGINTRDLKSLEVSAEDARDLIKYVPEDCFALYESGIENSEQIKEMMGLGYDGFLIGTSFMRHPVSPGTALNHILSGWNRVQADFELK